MNDPLSPPNASTPSTDVSYLGMPPLIAGENPKHYQLLFDEVFKDVQPRDIIEKLLARDVVDLTWDICRTRRIIKSSYEELSNMELAYKIATSKSNEKIASAQKLAEKAANGSAEALVRVSERLIIAGGTMDSAYGRALQEKFYVFERLDNILASAQARRIGTLRELDRHRASFARTMRAAIGKIEEAEFNEVTKPETGNENG